MIDIVVLFLVLGLLVVINVPIGIALAVVSVVAMAITTGTSDLANVGLIMFDGATGFALITIPLFILAGAIMNASGISRRLINLASALLGWMRGALMQVTVGASAFLSEVSGSAVAGVAAIGSVLMPAAWKLAEKTRASPSRSRSMMSARVTGSMPDCPTNPRNRAATSGMPVGSRSPSR